MNWYLDVLKKYAVFNGRARRKEYWMFTLFNVIVSIVIGAIDMGLGLSIGASSMGILGLIYTLAILLPAIGVSIRRLHDTGRSGWWLLLVLIPFIGPLVLLVFFVMDSTPGDNQYGPNPKGV
jgi:uncharacterized membrane protein YhaH (DUF805 family)